MKRPLTAQEALDVLGFIPWSSTAEKQIPCVVEKTTEDIHGIAKGTRVLLIERMEELAHREACSRVGWSQLQPPFIYRYKAVAE